MNIIFTTVSFYLMVVIDTLCTGVQNGDWYCGLAKKVANSSNVLIYLSLCLFSPLTNDWKRFLSYVKIGTRRYNEDVWGVRTLGSFAFL